MSVPKERPPEPTQYNSLDVFQETVGIPVAEEIHDGGCNRAEQKEKHQTFPRKEKVSSSIYQYLKESHRTAAEKKNEKSDCGQNEKSERVLIRLPFRELQSRSNDTPLSDGHQHVSKKGQRDDTHDDARSTKHLGTWADKSGKEKKTFVNRNIKVTTTHTHPFDQASTCP